VPRWRTMIAPADTVWPPNTLTPSIFGCESRPLRVEPPPFFCAISDSWNWFAQAGLTALILISVNDWRWPWLLR